MRKQTKYSKIISMIKAGATNAEIIAQTKAAKQYVYSVRSKVNKQNASPKTVLSVSTTNVPVLPDMVNHPPHYKAGGVETIDFIEAKKLNYNLGNVVKYISRHDLKGDRLENLRKAQWYLDREINNLKQSYKSAPMVNK